MSFHVGPYNSGSNFAYPLYGFKIVHKKFGGNYKVMDEMMNESVLDPDRISPTGGRRSGIERREFSFTAHVPERRTGEDRRNSDDRRQKPRIMTYWQRLKEHLSEKD